ncbi:MAG TPA: serine protease, partial [Acidimicrobiaceae bacterium]|nr:serine protease [Acidimicrobiaceae bacterium]
MAPLAAVAPHSAAAVSASVDRGSVAESPTGRYLVRVANAARPESTVTRVPGARVVQRLSAVAGAAVVEADHASATTLADSPGVLDIVPDEALQLGDTQDGATWGLDRIDQLAQPLDGSYTFPNTGTAVAVYVLDSGVYNHPDFGGRVAEGTSTIDNGIGRVDCNGHGTHVAGTIGSATYGVAKNVSIVPIRVASCDGGLWLIDALEGVDWAIAHHTGGPAVLNASLGGSANSWWVQWVNAAVADGITMVVAAGNQYGLNACNYSPANVPAAITVGSTEIDDWVSSFSNLGACVDLFAPGGSIQSLAASGSGSASKSGTSMATPHVAGAAALLLAAAPWLTPAQVADNLVATASTGQLLGALGGAPNRLLRVHPTIAPPPNDSATAATLLNPWGGAVDADRKS